MNVNHRQYQYVGRNRQGGRTVVSVTEIVNASGEVIATGKARRVLKNDTNKIPASMVSPGLSLSFDRALAAYLDLIAECAE